MFLLKKKKIDPLCCFKNYLEKKKLFSLEKSHNTNLLKIL